MAGGLPLVVKVVDLVKLQTDFEKIFESYLKKKKKRLFTFCYL